MDLGRRLFNFHCPRLFRIQKKKYRKIKLQFNAWFIELDVGNMCCKLGLRKGVGS